MHGCTYIMTHDRSFGAEAESSNGLSQQQQESRAQDWVKVEVVRHGVVQRDVTWYGRGHSHTPVAHLLLHQRGSSVPPPGPARARAAPTERQILCEPSTSTAHHHQWLSGPHAAVRDSQVGLPPACSFCPQRLVSLPAAPGSTCMDRGLLHQQDATPEQQPDELLLSIVADAGKSAKARTRALPAMVQPLGGECMATGQALWRHAHGYVGSLWESCSAAVCRVLA